MNRIIIAIFSKVPYIVTEDNLGYNLHQRSYFIKSLRLLPMANIKDLKLLWQYVHDKNNEVCIVTQRNIISAIGFLFRIFFKNVRWVVDLPDCPFKESAILYKNGSFKWLKSYLKSVLVYFLFRFADRIIVNFEPRRFYSFYKGKKEKVHCFKNALPNLPEIHKPIIPSFQKSIIFVYVGSGLEALGLSILIKAIETYNKTAELPVELHIYGHYNADKNGVIYHGKRPRREIIEALKNSHAGVSPILRGADVEFAYPIKSMEYFCYGNKLILSSTHGMLAQFENVETQDIYFAEPGNIDSLVSAINLCVSDIMSIKCDNIRHLAGFSAERKNMEIEEIYNKVFAE